MSVLRVVSPGLQTTVQDLGRFGWAHFGISASGAADPFALRAGNLLVGNAENAAALEMTLMGGAFEFEAEHHPCVGRFGFRRWIATVDARGSKGRTDAALRAVAIGRALLFVRARRDRRSQNDGERVHTRDYRRWRTSAEGGRSAADGKRGDSPPAPRPEKYSSAGKWPAARDRRSAGGSFRGRSLSRQLHRGGRIESHGSAITRSGDRERGRPHAHRGRPLGAVQVPPDGQPIILFVEHQTTGGYPKPANVISADFRRLGQLRPRNQVSFERVTIEQALRELQQQEQWLYGL